jgi:hypothetical protein
MNAWVGAVYFVLFEGVFWVFSVDLFRMLRNGSFTGWFDLAIILGSLVLSIFCFKKVIEHVGLYLHHISMGQEQC